MEELEKKFKDEILSHKEEKGEFFISVKKQKIHDILKYCRDNLSLDLLIDLGGIDYGLKTSPRFGVFYVLYSSKTKKRIIIKTEISEDDLKIHSVCDIYKVANWNEREAFDNFGIEFVGHPDLKRILNAEDYDAWPMRKDFPVDKRWE